MAIYCTQYNCLNNTGLEQGKIRTGLGGKCKLEDPGRHTTDDGKFWSCAAEFYPGEIVKLNCAGCGKEIEVKNWTYGAQYYCNNECVNKGITALPAGSFSLQYSCNGGKLP